MSNFEKVTPEELKIRKAKYRVKNELGKYEVVYLETSADQVEETADRVFVTPAEKAKIGTNAQAIATETQNRVDADKALSQRLQTIEGEGEGSVKKALADAKVYTDEKVKLINGVNSGLESRIEANENAVKAVPNQIATAKTEAVEAAKAHTTEEVVKLNEAFKNADAAILADAKADATSKVEAAKDSLNKTIDTLAQQVTVHESDITNLKDAVANKNNNTVVVNTESEIADANPTPKVGDMAYVISSKRAYIFKGIEVIVEKDVPTGWVVFDEITNEVDLVDYLKKSDAEATYRKLSNKIAEGDLAEALVNKINEKQTAGQVDAKVNAAKDELKVTINKNTTDITKEVSDRKGEITRVEGLVTAEVDARTKAIEAAKTQLSENVTTVSTKADKIETDYKAANSVLTQRVNKFVPVVGSTQPEGTETGHVWLEITGA